MFFNADTRKCSITNVTWAGFPLGHAALGRIMASTPSFGFLRAPDSSPHKVRSPGHILPSGQPALGRTYYHLWSPSSPSTPPWSLLPWLPQACHRDPESFSGMFHHCHSTATPLPAPPVSSTIRYTTPALHSSRSSLWMERPLPIRALPLL